jgi:Radical SAM superfamily
VHDMFTVDRRRVVDFCQAMQESGEGLRWSCSARTDCVDPELLELMAESGCTGLFFGIESGSPDQQRRMGKHLDLDEARRVIECAASHGIANTVSLIIGFPEETPEDFSQTVGFMLDAARHDHSEPQLHLLAPLAGTPLALRCRDRIRLDTEIFSDASVSAAGLRADSPEHAMIAAYPDLFINFYLVPTLLPTAYLNEARLFLSRAIRRCRWLIIALDQEAGILDVFDRWRTWRKSLPNAVRYYHERAFLNDLLAFVEATYYDRGYPATDVMFRYVKELLLHVDDDVPAFESAGSAAHESDFFPVLAANAQLLSVKGSVPAVIEALKVRRAPATSDVVRDVRLLVRRTPPQWHEITELPEISGAVLQLCDGSRRVSEIIDAFGESGPTFEGASPEAVCDHTLRYLADARIIEFHAAGIVAERHAGLAF